MSGGCDSGHDIGPHGSSYVSYTPMPQASGIYRYETMVSIFSMWRQ